MRERISRFMMGRYGVDELGRFMMFVTLAGIVVSLFWSNLILEVVIWVMMIWTYFRMFSRNTAKRYAENLKFTNFKDRLFHRSGRSGQYSQSAQANRVVKDPYHRIYHCPSCNQKIRVPKGKGKICITCPSCRKEFVKRT